MRLHCENPAVRRRRDPVTGAVVEFDENGAARCRAETGEALATRYDDVRITDDERAESESETDSDSGETE